MNVLTIKQLQVKNDTNALVDNLDLTLTNDDWLTVTGPSGTGKSLLFKTIARFRPLSKGQILLDNQDITNIPINEYRQKVSYAVQSPQLFGQTVRDNLDLPFTIRQLVPDEDKQIVGLAKMALPATYLDKPIDELSGGERQRVGVLRHLIFPPKVLLLDEISTGLDAVTKEIIWQAIRDLQAETHFVVMSITHDATEIANAAWQLSIVDGQGVLTHE